MLPSPAEFGFFHAQCVRSWISSLRARVLVVLAARGRPTIVNQGIQDMLGQSCSPAFASAAIFSTMISVVGSSWSHLSNSASQTR
jgi:hypothetical protein